MNAALTVALFSPSALGLLLAFLVGKRNGARPPASFRAGVALHVCNLLLSPCVPAYLFYVDKTTGGGSAAGILDILILPATWLIFFLANFLISKAAAGGAPGSTRSEGNEQSALTQAITSTLLSYRQTGAQPSIPCPICRSAIQLETKAAHTIGLHCACGAANGTYKLQA